MTKEKFDRADALLTNIKAIDASIDAIKNNKLTFKIDTGCSQGWYPEEYQKNHIKNYLIKSFKADKKKFQSEFDKL